VKGSSITIDGVFIATEKRLPVARYQLQISQLLDIQVFEGLESQFCWKGLEHDVSYPEYVGPESFRYS
jgi:hypothetical protein